ncbi:MAG: hypothetical protein K2G02_07700, partial [Phocaeicola sp.]|nr:hypothetical protein [Phocaeicola sp.]
VYVLHIADETGKFQDVTLPATSDSFTAEALSQSIHVYLQEAKWKTFTDAAHKARLAALTKAFPEIANYKKDDLMKQGGNLPVIITPANVELTDDFSFSLQGIDGKVSGAVLSNPVKGLVGSYQQYGTSIYTRAADEKACLWTLSLELEKNKKGDAYVDITKPHSLVVENAKGTAVRTAFAYTASKQQVNNVVVSNGTNTVSYADEIDVLVGDEKYGALFTITDGMNDHFILEVAEPADVEKYGITVEGSKLKIANYPAGVSGIWIRNVKLTALGLNGSTDEAKQNIYVRKNIEAESSLSDKVVTLTTTLTNGKYVKNVRWNGSELNMSAVELEAFMGQWNKQAELKW